jgi:uncharacterized protein (DUF983 family)
MHAYKFRKISLTPSTTACSSECRRFASTDDHNAAIIVLPSSIIVIMALMVERSSVNISGSLSVTCTSKFRMKCVAWYMSLVALMFMQMFSLNEKTSGLSVISGEK